ncbi:protein kinase [Nocardia otitidiscaviarum]|uniref:non-specific serine/threonine protein kinase n=1 Tax=Nocardia otitidiscaviarum TaxID=1823 RepID=A0A516NGA8_9NOCA|nr:serine/threonine-protein kinase [Nocardia otitidiscaviarum]QDP77946.1 protein kinase [Nocardia otitidiscaviarum]
MLNSGEDFAGYVIERELGRGGMGSVYLAKHPRLPRMTALKLLNQEMFSDDEIRARFIREADLVAQLDHPNIVTVYDRGAVDEQLWISMQYIDGVNAAAVDPGKLPPLRAVQIITETAKALDYAHGIGVLHRDVKPANILLARSGRAGAGGERVYLTDFGIARLRDDTGHLTQTGTVTATLAYASPEQLTGATLDGRSDQYSLACTLFQLLTGSVPFEGTSPAAVIRGHLQERPRLPSTLRADLPPAVDGVLARALSKRPQDRYHSCTEFANAAERAFAISRTAPPQPVQPPRPPTPARPQPVVPHTPSSPRPLVGQQGPMGQSAPHSPPPGQVGPQSSPRNPQAGQPNPQSTPYHPQAGQVGPQSAPYTPQAGQVGPQSAPYTPQAGQVGPQSAPFNPQAGSPNPQSAPHNPLASHPNPPSVYNPSQSMPRPAPYAQSAPFAPQGTPPQPYGYQAPPPNYAPPQQGSGSNTGIILGIVAAVIIAVIAVIVIVALA